MMQFKWNFRNISKRGLMRNISSCISRHTAVSSAGNLTFTQTWTTAIISHSLPIWSTFTKTVRTIEMELKQNCYKTALFQFHFNCADSLINDNEPTVAKNKFDCNVKRVKIQQVGLAKSSNVFFNFHNKSKFAARNGNFSHRIKSHS